MINKKLTNLQTLLLITFLIFQGVKIAECGMKVTADTRYSPTFARNGDSDAVFGQKIKDAVENAPQNSGYCKKDILGYPVSNRGLCGANNSIGWIWSFIFDDPEDANYRIQFATDMGGGMAIFVDDVLDVVDQQDIWWEKNWNSSGVVRMEYDFPAGSHTVKFYGQEACCDGDMWVRFSRNGQPWGWLTEENFGCATTNNCPGVVCGDDQYQDGWECKDCEHQCDGCGVRADNCDACSDDATRVDDNTCACIPKYYDVNGQASCVPCLGGCATCSNGTSCDTCEDHHYQDPNNAKCFACNVAYVSECDTCNPDECLTCANDPTFVAPLCTGTVCQSDEYQVGMACRPCHASCTECSDSTTCTKCAADEYLKDGACYSCIGGYGSKCGTCNQFECLTCQNDPTFFLPDCTQDHCENTHYADDMTCRLCGSSCSSCPDQFDCVSCLDGTYKELVDHNGVCIDCNFPCATCEDGTVCKTCERPHFILTPTSNCVECESGYFLNDAGYCVSCIDFYGATCAECNTIECTECLNDPSFVLPYCEDTSCPIKEYEETKICRDCGSHCLYCDDNSTCTTCQDQFYLHADGTCQPCTGECFLCSSETECIVCNNVGYAAPNCVDCGWNYYKTQPDSNGNTDCLSQCPVGQFQNVWDNTCDSCDPTCYSCTANAYYCTGCHSGKVLHSNTCVDCFDILGMEQNPDEEKGVCQEKCGDGILVENGDGTHQCDDGNLIDGDGCSSTCQIERGYECDRDSQLTPDVCLDKRPIAFRVSFFFEQQYLNIEENAKLNCLLTFNKTFTLQDGGHIKDKIQILVDGIDTSNWKLNVRERVWGSRMLGEFEMGQKEYSDAPQYDIEIETDTTIKGRNIIVDLSPKSDFDDGNGNGLVSEKPQKEELKEYYYYSEDERYYTRQFEFFMQIGIMVTMLFLPFYIFVYKNHFNRFYVLFFVIDITQILYFYRFINIRWPINGIKFFRKLRPVISFYMPNLFENDIDKADFEKYSSGVTKFDTEFESAMFMNNTGSLLILLFIMLALHLVLLIGSQKRLYKSPAQASKVFQFFHQIRYGYFQWGVWFDCMLSASGVFIIYIFLQLTNTYDMVNFWLAVGVGALIFGFFIFCAIYTKKHLSTLYTEQTDEPEDGMKLEEKVAHNKTFYFRNIWFFIDRLYDYPKKSYFYFFFVIRKIFIAIVLLTLQAHPKIQLSMFIFSHLVLLFGLLKFRIFKDKSQTIRIIASEIFVIIGVGCMYFLLDDQSEDESFRLNYCWIVLSALLFSLFLQCIFFVWQEIIYPIYLWCLYKKKPAQVKDLRKLREEGKIANLNKEIPLHNRTSQSSAGFKINLNRLNQKESDSNMHNGTPSSQGYLNSAQDFGSQKNILPSSKRNSSNTQEVKINSVNRLLHSVEHSPQNSEVFNINSGRSPRRRTQKRMTGLTNNESGQVTRTSNFLGFAQKEKQLATNNSQHILSGTAYSEEMFGTQSQAGFKAVYKQEQQQYTGNNTLLEGMNEVMSQDGSSTPDSQKQQG